MHERMSQVLEGRRLRGTLRRLPAATTAPSKRPPSNHHASPMMMIDFSSNDYLGLAQDPEQIRLVEQKWQQIQRTESFTSSVMLGATGSRLLSGDSCYFHSLETHLAQIHNRRHALLCNSGYDANLTVVSSLPCDCILYDEYAHNSLHMGLRLWQSWQSTMSPSDHPGARRRQSSCESFKHNDLVDLEAKLSKYYAAGTIIAILIESVYSMDGDVAPLAEILAVAHRFGARVVVDEAHGLGLFGPTGTGVLAAVRCEQHPALYASIHTFGKAAGCHGAVICCNSNTTLDYLVNYGYPLIYSTALPMHSLVTIRCAYETITGEVGAVRRQNLQQRVQQFRSALEPSLSDVTPTNDRAAIALLPSMTPIQALRIPGNALCTEFCQRLHQRSQSSIRLFPIKSPTVPVGQERVRIVLHAHNTLEQVSKLVQLILETLEEMNLLVVVTSGDGQAQPSYLMRSRL